MNEKTVDTWFDSEPPKANVLHFNINPKNVLNKSLKGEKWKKHYEQKGYEKGMIIGTVRGAIVTIGLLAVITFGKNKISNIFHQHPKDYAFEYGQTALINNTTRGSVIDGAEIVGDYMELCDDVNGYENKQFDDDDFDSYIGGVYAGMMYLDPDSRLNKMNNIFYRFNIAGYTEYDNFVKYCDAIGCCKTDQNGKKTVDENAYRTWLKSYIEKVIRLIEAEGDVMGSRSGGGPK